MNHTDITLRLQTCSDVQQRFEGLLYGTIDRETEARMLRHMDMCDECPLLYAAFTEREVEAAYASGKIERPVTPLPPSIPMTVIRRKDGRRVISYSAIQTLRGAGDLAARLEKLSNNVWDNLRLSTRRSDTVQGFFSGQETAGATLGPTHQPSTDEPQAYFADVLDTSDKVVGRVELQIVEPAHLTESGVFSAKVCLAALDLHDRTLSCLLYAESNQWMTLVPMIEHEEGKDMVTATFRADASPGEAVDVIPPDEESLRFELVPEE
jgi:hypothetical protein